MDWLESKVNRASEVLGFLYAQRVSGFVVEETPTFDDAGAALFMRRLDRANSYIEFGSGGSTLAAARRGVPLIAVESDWRFLRSVRRKLVELECYDEAAQKLLYVNIGLTEAWGAPAIRRPVPARLSRWRAYPAAPWPESETMAAPHLVLVDGRFRVACALQAARFLSARDGEVLIDDYVDRPHYHAVERHLILVERGGRMARFKPRPDLDVQALKADLEFFSKDYR